MSLIKYLRSKSSKKRGETRRSLPKTRRTNYTLRVLEREAQTDAGQAVVEAVVAVEVTRVNEGADVASNAILDAATDAAVALAEMFAPGRAAADEGVRSEAKALDRVAEDQAA